LESRVLLLLTSRFISRRQKTTGNITFIYAKFNYEIKKTIKSLGHEEKAEFTFDEFLFFFKHNSFMAQGTIFSRKIIPVFLFVSKNRKTIAVNFCAKTSSIQVNCF